MNEQIINELLEQLKSNLENVESAKQQVEKTVGAYNAFEGQVNGFVSELGFITQNTRTIINQLEEVKKKFLSNVSTNLENKITQGERSVNSNIDVARNEVLQQSNDIKTDVNTSKEVLLDKVDTVKDTIIADIQNTKNTVTTGLSNLEQRILQQVKENGDLVQTEISDSTSSIKQIAYWAIGLSFVTLCLIIYILTKL